MKINEKKITGMFKYDPEITFTEGDFIISNENRIFVVIKEVLGKNPDENFSEYFTPYTDFSDRELATLEDFKAYAKEEASSVEDGNRLVSVDLMTKILDTYLVGISFGKISSSIFSNEIWFSDYAGRITKTTCDNDPLDVILERSDLNNAYFKIMDSVLLNSLGLGSIDIAGNPITGILRQYTYEDFQNNVVRVQEVVEPSSGLLLFRYSISPDGTTFEKNSTSSWRGYVKIIDDLTVNVENAPASGDANVAVPSIHNSTAWANVLESARDKIEKNMQSYYETGNY